MAIRRPGFPAAAGREFSALCAEINEGVSVAKRPLSAAKGKNAAAFFRLTFKFQALTRQSAEKTYSEVF
ncbi:MAG: hypothetical protein A2270_07585 [Elusimicrobia bacterium RIFOXYA12_FULL_51_18]|nr:MAG: hypothetical protein A2270_07585 [Elusimicrobia bacterium RIFOXYA12_FULL_51_18]OGS28538.1 MAG: hypothetical protein A2218_05890 [Elusimicrobia bacterium RIFOXYA2_FULL_53_38]